MSAAENKSPREWLGENPRFRVRLIAGGVGLVLLALTLSLWNFSLIFLRLPMIAQTRQQNQLATERFSNYMQRRLETLRSVQRFYTLSESLLTRGNDGTGIDRFVTESELRARGGNRALNERDFQQFCESAVGNGPGILAILLTDMEGVPIWIAPDLAGLSRQEIYGLTTDLRFTNALSVSADDNRTVITDPISLPLHGSGILAAVPVESNRRHVGYIVGVLAVPDLINALTASESEGIFRLQIQQGVRTIYPPQGEDASSKPALWYDVAVSSPVILDGQQWMITVAPLASQKIPAWNLLSLSVLILGLCLTAIVTYALHKILWRAVRLQREASDQRSRLERTGLSLMEIKTQLDLVIDNVDEGVVLYDDQLNPIQANASFLTLFRMAENSPSMENGRRHHAAMARIFGRETRYQSLFEEIRRDPVRTFTDELEMPSPREPGAPGRRTFLRRGVAVADAQGELHAILVIFKDISMIKDIERVKDEFLSSVTHELRSPLASIKGFAETLQRDPGMPEPTRAEFVSIICEESARLQHLIEELLDLRRLQSRGMAMRIVPYDLKLLSDDIVRGAHSISLAKNIKIQVAWEGEDQARLRGDVAQIGRALRNLLVNAVKYSPPGGTIQLRGRAKGKRVSLEISDQGTGISEKDLPYIFDQFYRGTSKGRQKGTGLGLAIVKHIVEMHGGQLGVRSEVGSGTSFRIELPREFQPPVAGGANGEPHEPAAPPGRPAPVIVELSAE